MGLLVFCKRGKQILMANAILIGIPNKQHCQETFQQSHDMCWDIPYLLLKEPLAK